MQGQEHFCALLALFYRDELLQTLHGFDAEWCRRLSSPIIGAEVLIMMSVAG